MDLVIQTNNESDESSSDQFLIPGISGIPVSFLTEYSWLPSLDATNCILTISFLHFQICRSRRSAGTVSLQSESFVRVRRNRRSWRLHFWNARPGIRLRMSESEYSEGVHSLFRFRSFFSTETISYGGLPRNPFGLLRLRQAIRVCIVSGIEVFFLVKSPFIYLFENIFGSSQQHLLGLDFTEGTLKIWQILQRKIQKNCQKFCLQIHNGSYLGLPPFRRRRLHLSLPSWWPENTETKKTARMVQENARQRDYRTNCFGLQSTFLFFEFVIYLKFCKNSTKSSQIISVSCKISLKHVYNLKCKLWPVAHFQPITTQLCFDCLKTDHIWVAFLIGITVYTSGIFAKGLQLQAIRFHRGTWIDCWNSRTIYLPSSPMTVDNH